MLELIVLGLPIAVAMRLWWLAVRAHRDGPLL